MSNVYEGRLGPSGEFLVTKNGQPFHARDGALALVGLSAGTAFRWGIVGEGTNLLALALLYEEATAEEAFLLKFAWRDYCDPENWPAKWILSGEVIRSWLRSQAHLLADVPQIVPASER